MDCIPPGSSVHGTSQTRILEWVAISFSRGLPEPGIEPASSALQADSLLLLRSPEIFEFPMGDTAGLCPVLCTPQIVDLLTP